MTMTPGRYLELATLMEQEGPSLLRERLEDDPQTFWDMFGRFANLGRQWADLSDDELAQINERFVAFIRKRARLSSN